MTLPSAGVSVDILILPANRFMSFSLEKYLQAARALEQARSLDAQNPELHIRTADFRLKGAVHWQ